MTTHTPVIVTVTNAPEADFEPVSYLENELTNHGIAARIVDAGEYVAVLRQAIRLMPLGTKKRAEWLVRASALEGVL